MLADFYIPMLWNGMKIAVQIIIEGVKLSKYLNFNPNLALISKFSSKTCSSECWPLSGGFGHGRRTFFREKTRKFFLELFHRSRKIQHVNKLVEDRRNISIFGRFGVFTSVYDVYNTPDHKKCLTFDKEKMDLRFFVYFIFWCMWNSWRILEFEICIPN